MDEGLAATYVTTMAVDSSAEPLALYAGTDGGRVFIWNGAHWQDITGNLATLAVYALELGSGTSPGKLYAGTWSGVWQWDGAVWTSISSGLPDLGVSALASDGQATPALLFAGTGTGVYQWDGSSWTSVTGGAGVQNVHALELDPRTNPQTLYAGSSTERGHAYEGDIYRWNGTAWTHLPSQKLKAPLTTLSLNLQGGSTEIYVATWGAGIFRWDGRHWSKLESGACAAFQALALDTSRVPPVPYAGGCGVFQWNGGAWSGVGSGLPFDYSQALAFDFKTVPPTLYAASSNCGVYAAQIPVPPPTISRAAAGGQTFQLVLRGANFHPSAQIQIDGAPAPQTVYKSGSKLMAKGGAELKAMLPKGVAVQITVKNEDDGGGSVPFSFKR